MPDNLTPSDQGRGTPHDKRQNTETVRRAQDRTQDELPASADDTLPISRREAQRAGQAMASDDDVPGETRPSERHPNRPEREKAGGNYNGPDKR